MANHQSQNPSTNQSTTTVIWDANGQPVIAIGLNEYIVSQPDGSMESRRLSHNIILVDGTAWNPGMLTSNPPIYIGICEQCRTFSVSGLRVRRPSHGLTTLARAKICAGCGTLCCPHHRKLGSDNKWRCLSCSKRHAAGWLLKRIFFMKKEG